MRGLCGLSSVGTAAASTAGSGRPRGRACPPRVEGPVVKDSRIAEIAWMVVIAVQVAAGGNIVLGLLAEHRGFAVGALGVVVVLAFLAPILAFVAIGLHVHGASGACIAAAEAALVFDIVTIAARPSTACPEPVEGGKERI